MMRREENALDTVDRALGTCGVTTQDLTSVTLEFWKERKRGQNWKSTRLNNGLKLPKVGKKHKHRFKKLSKLQTD